MERKIIRPDHTSVIGIKRQKLILHQLLAAAKEGRSCFRAPTVNVEKFDNGIVNVTMQLSKMKRVCPQSWGTLFEPDGVWSVTTGILTVTNDNGTSKRFGVISFQPLDAYEVDKIIPEIVDLRNRTKEGYSFIWFKD